jgi:hypothetical protein
VSEIRKWLPEVGLANARFHPGPRNGLEVEQSGVRTDSRGQFVFAVDECQHNPDADDLFEQHSWLRRLPTLLKQSVSTAFS